MAQQPPAVPHLSQAWVAQSSGDGLPGATGKESYLFEDCPGKHGGQEPTDNCIQAHIFDYGAQSCIKIEINAGFHSNASGTYLLKCDSVDCCYEGDEAGEPPDVKQWDIFHSNGRFNPTHPEVKYLGKRNTTELNDVVVPNADAWSEKDHLPFTNHSAVNYTYYITLSDDRKDTISHRIDFFAPGAEGSILYGDFQVISDVAALRETIKQYVPAECLHPNVLACNTAHSKKWNRKLPPTFGHLGRYEN
jgi:hypothetical protein